jgi:F0F1-type ATP synthase assembly protein I
VGVLEPDGLRVSMEDNQDPAAFGGRDLLGLGGFLVGAVVGCTVIGLLVDAALNCSPIGVVVGVATGIVLGAFGFVARIRKALREQTE